MTNLNAKDIILHKSVIIDSAGTVQIHTELKRTHHQPRITQALWIVRKLAEYYWLADDGDDDGRHGARGAVILYYLYTQRAVLDCTFVCIDVLSVRESDRAGRALQWLILELTCKALSAFNCGRLLN